MVPFLESGELLESFATLSDVGAGNNVCGVGHAPETVRWHVVAEVLRRAGFKVSDSIATGPDLGAICVVIDDLESHEINWPLGDITDTAGELRATVFVGIERFVSDRDRAFLELALVGSVRVSSSSGTTSSVSVAFSVSFPAPLSASVAFCEAFCSSDGLPPAPSPVSLDCC